MERENILTFRLNDKEKQLIKRLAERDGLTVSSWIRAQVHKEARRYNITEEKADADSIDNC